MRSLPYKKAAVEWLSQRVTGKLTADSRSVQAGDGFIAWPGTKNDGRAFVNAALENGAVACLVEQNGVASFEFSDDRIASYEGLKEATGPISSDFFGQPSRHLDLVAVTGTNGKTSTAYWIAQALSNLPLGGERCGLIGTFGAGIPDFSGRAETLAGESLPGIRSTGLTTPDPVKFQEALHFFVGSGVRYCAAEASSIGLSERRMHGTSIATAIFTNLTLDHLDYHGTLANYWAAKRELFSWPELRNAVVNLDDSYGAQLVRDLKESSPGLMLWTYSSIGDARVRAEGIQAVGRGMQMQICEQDEKHELKVELIGRYNISNLLCVIGALRSLGFSLRDTVKACHHLRPVPGRMECFGEVDGPMVVVDYAHTPDALEKALQALSPYVKSSGRLVCVFGCGGDRDASKRPLMGAIAARLASQTILTNDNPRFEVAEAILAQIHAGMPKNAQYCIEPDRDKAIRLAIHDAQAGDVILIAGKGHESFQEISGKRYPFSDRLSANSALSRRQPTNLGLRNAA